MTTTSHPTVSVHSTSEGLVVRWARSAVGPADGSYSIRPSVAIEPSAAATLAALPVLIAMSRNGGVIKLQPAHLRERGISAAERRGLARTLTGLGALFEQTISKLYADTVAIRLELDADDLPSCADAETPRPASPEGLLFGGGVESLLSLARMRERGTPALLSLSGPRWTGSDPVVDREKLEFDQRVARELGLRLLQTETDAYDAMTKFQSAWQHGARGRLFFANAVAFAPLVVGLTAPLIGSRVLSSVHLGSENDHADYHTVYCLSPEFLQGLSTALSPSFAFVPELLELSKPAIVTELWQRAPELGRLQHSCFSGRGARWCCECEKCFRSYALLRIASASPDAVELDAARLLKNLPRYARRIANLMAFSSYHVSVYRELLRRAVAQGDGLLAALLTTFLALASGLRVRAAIGARARTKRAHPTHG